MGRDRTRVEKKQRSAFPPQRDCSNILAQNRKPKEWRDRQEHEHMGEVGVKIVDDICEGRLSGLIARHFDPTCSENQKMPTEKSGSRVAGGDQLSRRLSVYR